MVAPAAEGEASAGVGAATEEGEEDIEGGTPDRAYSMSPKEEYNSLGLDGAGVLVDPIPWEKESEEASPNIAEEELEALYDDNGYIRYWKVVEFLLPTIGGDSYFTFLAKRR